jgi:hypothetical protein
MEYHSLARPETRSGGKTKQATGSQVDCIKYISGYARHLGVESCPSTASLEILDQECGVVVHAPRGCRACATVADTLPEAYFGTYPTFGCRYSAPLHQPNTPPPPSITMRLATRSCYTTITDALANTITRFSVRIDKKASHARCRQPPTAQTTPQQQQTQGSGIRDF